MGFRWGCVLRYSKAIVLPGDTDRGAWNRDTCRSPVARHPEEGEDARKNRGHNRIKIPEVTQSWNNHCAPYRPYHTLGRLCHHPGWPLGRCPLAGECGEANHEGGAQFQGAHWRKRHQPRNESVCSAYTRAGEASLNVYPYNSGQ